MSFRRLSSMMSPPPGGMFPSKILAHRRPILLLDVYFRRKDSLNIALVFDFENGSDCMSNSTAAPMVALRRERSRQACLKAIERKTINFRVVYLRGCLPASRYSRHGKLRPHCAGLRSRGTTRGDSSGEVWQTRGARRKTRSDRGDSDQHRNNPQQNHSRSGPSSLRLSLPGNLRRELPRKGTDHDGGSSVPCAACDQNRDRCDPRATFAEWDRSVHRHGKLRRPSSRSSCWFSRPSRL